MLSDTLLNAMRPPMPGPPPESLNRMWTWFQVNADGSYHIFLENFTDGIRALLSFAQCKAYCSGSSGLYRSSHINMEGVLLDVQRKHNLLASVLVSLRGQL